MLAYRLPLSNGPQANGDHSCPVQLLDNLTVTEVEVSKRLAALDVRKAAGDDGIPTKLLKTVATEIAHSLCYLFNLSLSTAQFPDELKEATITPVLKSVALLVCRQITGPSLC